MTKNQIIDYIFLLRGRLALMVITNKAQEQASTESLGVSVWKQQNGWVTQCHE